MTWLVQPSPARRIPDDIEHHPRDRLEGCSWPQNAAVSRSGLLLISYKKKCSCRSDALDICRSALLKNEGTVRHGTKRFAV
jgi:hypothetical protein